MTGGFPVLWSWLQWTDTQKIVVDVNSVNYQQHVDAVPSQVLLLPQEVCAYLIAKSSSWVILTVVPSLLSYVYDSLTGLDEVFLNSNSPWGVDGSGRPYFDTDGASSGERRRLLVIAGVPYLDSP